MQIIRTLAVAVCAGLLQPTLSAAQETTGTLRLTIGFQASAAQPAQVIVLLTLNGTTGPARTDSTDAATPLVFAALVPGRYRVELRAIGHVPDTSFAEIRTGVTTSASVVMRRIVALDPVAIEGSKGLLAGFEKRRTQGKGTFLTRADLDKTRRNQLTDALRSVRGLRVDCGNGCKVHMVRSTACEPRYFINGFPSDAGILHTPILDVAGIEIYRGPSETPGEFLGAQSMCGAIVIWTR